MRWCSCQWSCSRGKEEEKEQEEETDEEAETAFALAAGTWAERQVYMRVPQWFGSRSGQRDNIIIWSCWRQKQRGFNNRLDSSRLRTNRNSSITFLNEKSKWWGWSECLKAWRVESSRLVRVQSWARMLGGRRLCSGRWEAKLEWRWRCSYGRWGIGERRGIRGATQKLWAASKPATLALCFCSTGQAQLIDPSCWKAYHYNIHRT